MYLCMYVYVHMLYDYGYMYVGRHVCMYIHTHITTMHTYMCNHICIYVYMYIGRCAWAYLCACIYINTHYTHTNVRMHACMHWYKCDINVYISVYI